MTATPHFRTVLVTGGAGYVGSVLVPRLLALGHAVRVLDACIFGSDLLRGVANHTDFSLQQADIRDIDVVKQALIGVDAVIHLACISNDPSCELDPALARSINYDAFDPLVAAARTSGVRRFIFASSASVYGISDADNVTEDHPLVPITDYNRFKAMCEGALFQYERPDFTTVAIRPGTICGISPRQRLDLTVNLLTCHAVERGRITVFGGKQRRPSLHMADMVRLYERILEVPAAKIGGRAFNAGYENMSVGELAVLIRNVVRDLLPDRPPISIERVPSDDSRSYHICSDRLQRELGFAPEKCIRDAIVSVTSALGQGLIPEPLTGDQYHNVRVTKRAMSRLLAPGAVSKATVGG